MVLAHTAEEWATSPFPIDGSMPAKGLATVVAQEQELGNLPSDFRAEQVLRLEFVRQAQAELAERADLQEELARVQKWVEISGY